MSAKRWIQRGLPVVVSVGALAWLFSHIDPDAVLDALTWRVIAVLVPALLVYGAFALVLEAASILWLMEPVPAGFGAWTAARIKSASYLLGIVNYALGGAALTVLLRRRAGLGLGASASIVLLVSSLDIIVLVGFAAAAMGLSDSGEPLIRTGIALAAAFAFFGGLAILRAPGRLGPLEALRSLAVFDALRTTPLLRLGQVTVLRALFTASFLSLAWVTFYAFDIFVDVGELVVGMLVVAVVGALPIAVAGLGTSQAAFLEVFSKQADESTLMAMSLVLSAGLIVLRAGMGLVFAREFTREALEETQV